MGNSKPVEKKRKKKGRPSLLDIQKRSLRLQKQQQQQEQHKRNPNPNPNPSPSPSPNPNPNPYLRFPHHSSSSAGRRATRRNPNPDPPDAPDPGAADDEEDDDEAGSSGKRREKKLKLVLRLPTRSAPNSAPSGSDSDPGSSLRKRKTPGEGDRDKGERHSLSKEIDSHQDDPSNSGPTTPLPDKELLFFVLDRLQKKDTYGVFSEAVDPEELPDYHDIIKHPMDFGTVRKKLSSGAYKNLEQFEKDIFLISSNAMQYNAPDTIYYRQARSIQELAKKNFENLRQESDADEPEPKTVPKRGRPPSKNKKTVGKASEGAGLDFSSDAALSNAVGNNQRSISDYDMSRKGPGVDKPGNRELFTGASHGLRDTETFSWLSNQKAEKNEEFLGSAVKGVATKWGKKPTVIDENRRNTYRQPQLSTSVHELPVLATFDGERKQLVPVGLHVECAYARSLARFAATFGPIGWSIAAKKIERVLPPGTNYGRGWVGDREPTQQSQTPLLSTSCHPSPQLKTSSCPTISRTDELSQLFQRQEPSSTLKTVSEEQLNRTPPAASTSGRSSEFAGSAEATKIPNYGNGTSVSTGVGDNNIQAKASLRTINGFNPALQYNNNMPQQLGIRKMVGPARPFGSELQMTHAQALSMVSRSGNNGIVHSQKQMHQLETERAKSVGNATNSSADDPRGPWRGPSLQPKPESVPPDLNVGFQSPGSPGSGVVVDSKQPDLALQL
ncbi:Bromodomain-containing protein 1 [Ananas comosus]|uniref:Bromodomain-containing protein 1 n=1 Tax=Ananas comosus TaxID=4615 RepID=A0A199UXG0_ANACO|nr:Bromodomain-containing protein 1 [Ananas comosus]